MKERTFFVLSTVFMGIVSLPVNGAISYPRQQPAAERTPAPQQDAQTVQWPAEIKQEMVEARKAAQAWLKLVDEGRYEESWDQASVTFKSVIPKSSWVEALNAARRPLGGVKERSVTSQAPAMNPNRMPPGIYMVINYATSFALASQSGEFMTMRKDPDGKWRILDYRVN
jgi:hypothetical protein